ncbi:hypothetical protein KC19_VG206300 [Ceratodon purpureus]|uniref:Uncharacterized protein n=1 Tax=Ceratodon purpureus TaxID=3225 RepID=A0A8T0HSM0_CERPU|nr:hypothetical protein KC19_VG206300 [Ceratodon purpureus]
MKSKTQWPVPDRDSESHESNHCTQRIQRNRKKPRENLIARGGVLRREWSVGGRKRMRHREDMEQNGEDELDETDHLTSWRVKSILLLRKRKPPKHRSKCFSQR